ncbi:hypothetical protein EI200_19185 [Peribacillus simplex]|uniref:EamA family transporter n=1 Tax=Peribacillus simplex TaxID=1478 RepID=UPI000F644F8D|nr:hypothetical protein EI200_19185 [Peribacillus simplex]
MEIAVKGENFIPPCTRPYHFFIDTFQLTSATAVSVFLGLILVAPFAICSGLNLDLSSKTSTGLIYIGIFPSVGSFIFWIISLRHIRASQAVIYLNLIAVFMPFLAYF